jgi:hypothetical protein
MFENKASSDQSTSPPSRGRSPLDTDSENVRPLSKVRASFVAVEKPGQPGQAPQWGLRKASDVSSISGVNGNSTEDTSLRKVTSRNSTMTTNDQPAQKDLGLILKGSPFDDDKAAHTRQTKDLDQAMSSGQAEKQIPEIDTRQNSENQVKVTSTDSNVKSPISTTKPKPSTETSKTAPVKGPNPKEAAPKTSEKSPIGPRSPHLGKVNTTHPAPSIKGIRGGPAKIMAVMDSANKARVERERISAEIKPNQSQKKDIPKAPVTNSTKKEQAIPKTEKAPKPAPQPAKLPAAATTPTAASVRRTDGPPKSLNTDNRRVSAMRKDKPPPKVASIPTASSLAKKTPRNSLAPQTNGHERPKSRVSSAKDESFLARMMRPTASSQQKVHEKVMKADSPPRARKVSDKIRHSLGSTKKDEDKENEDGPSPEATKSIPDMEEQQEPAEQAETTETAVAQAAA